MRDFLNSVESPIAWRTDDQDRTCFLWLSMFDTRHLADCETGTRSQYVKILMDTHALINNAPVI